MINLCKKILGKTTKAPSIASAQNSPTVYTRDQHCVSRQLISDNALKVLYRLNKNGFDAYLVGGGVRDILLNQAPKDFDIATNATPDEIKELFRNCRLIGRRFRLAHIVFGRDVIEVATFRGHHENASTEAQNCQKVSKTSDHGMLLRDNIYGSIEEDAERRDFTINALYYSTKDFKVYDFANGIADINAKEIRLIGDPETRYREDPVRMLRAVRFATKLDMTINKDTQAPIKELAPLLENIPAARMFEEFIKLFISGKAEANFNLMREYELFTYFFPIVEQHLQRDDSDMAKAFISLAIRNTDARINNQQRVTPAFLLAAMLWYPLQDAIKRIKEGNDLTPQDTFFAALHELMSEQQRSISIPKRFQAVMKDIWILQDKLARREGKKAHKSFEHQKFRAGYDFLLLRAEIESQFEKPASGEHPLTELAQWWTDFQTVSSETKEQMIKSVVQSKTGPRRSRNRRKPRKANT